jgi:D-alanine-D-alanine ligase
MIRVGVAMGGPSSEHDISIMSGLNVLKALKFKKDKYDGYPIFITQGGIWLFGENGEWVSPMQAFSRIDVVFNALHGEFGEDGTIQQIFDQCGIPYTGSQALPSAIAMNKHMAQKILKGEGLISPRGVVMGPEAIDTRAVLALSSPPWIVKPRSRGSSIGVSKVSSRADLVGAFQKALKTDSHILAQEYIKGREVTCSVLEDLDGNLMALAPIEIVPPEGADFFDYTVKYNGKTNEICPAEFYGAMATMIKDTALRAHKALHLRHYSRTDMIIKSSASTRRAPELYVLEVNTLPGLTAESLLPKAARHAGYEFPDLIDHIVKLSKVV